MADNALSGDPIGKDVEAAAFGGAAASGLGSIAGEVVSRSAAEKGAGAIVRGGAPSLGKEVGPEAFGAIAGALSSEAAKEDESSEGNQSPGGGASDGEKDAGRSDND